MKHNNWKTIVFYNIFLLGTLFSVAKGGSDIVFVDAGDEIQYFDGKAFVDGQILSVFLIKYNQENLSTRVVSYLPEDLDHTYSGRSLHWFFKSNKARIAISGGILKTLYPPLPIGFVKTEFGILSSEHYNNYQEGYIGTIRDKAYLDIFPERRNLSVLENSKTEGVLQSWPLLLYKGKESPKILDFRNGEETTPLIKKEVTRLFVAIDKEGQVIFGMTGPISLLGLTNFLKLKRTHGGLECVDALNLSGTKYASLILEAGGVKIKKGVTTIRIANAIIVK